jgi:hypothetical protein
LPRRAAIEVRQGVRYQGHVGVSYLHGLGKDILRRDRGIEQHNFASGELCCWSGSRRLSGGAATLIEGADM